MKTLIKGLSISLLLGTVSLTAVPAEVYTWGCGIVNTKKTPLNIRADMDENAKVIATASKGSALACAATQESDISWYKVILDDGKTGYASSEFISCFSTEVEARCGLVKTQDTTLNVREGMGKDTKVIGKIRKGAMLRILDEEGEEGEWLRVQLNNGKMGYVHKDFVLVFSSNSEVPD